jgi:hypothetical protein
MPIYTLEQLKNKAGGKDVSVQPKPVSPVTATTARTPSTDNTAPVPSLADKIGSDFMTRAQNILTQYDTTGESVRRAGSGVIPSVLGATEVVARGAGEVAGVIGTTALETGKALLNKINRDNGETLAKSGEAFLDAKNILGPTNREVLAKVGEFIKDGTDNLPENVVQAYKNFFDTIGLMGGGGVKALETPVGQVPTIIKNTAKDIIEGVSTVSKPAINTVSKVTTPVINAVKDPVQVMNDTRTYIARNNVPENLGSSIDRLAKDSAETPLQKYNKYAEQEQKYKTNVKEDMAVGKVGEEIGNQYEKVIQQRRDVGAQLDTELNKIAEIPTDVTKPFTNLENELKRNGLTYDAESNTIGLSRTSKVTAQDAEILNEYVKSLNSLGANPSAAELDAFISRTSNEMDVYKAQKNITKVTNGERIVKNNLSELRKELSPEVNPAFAEYSKAKETYSALSKFLDEGSQFLGSKTSAGDYAKDASLVKSSVQSIVNNGRKDWLLKLEDLTGYKALDEAVLALQAAADAGNYKGKSLLDVLNPKQSGNIQIPTSGRGFLMRGVEKIMDAGTSKFVGSPADQTRRAILERMNMKTSIPAPISNTSNRIIKESVPQKEGVIQKLINRYKSLPNKQGGFVRLPFSNKIVKAIDDMTKQEIYELDKYLEKSLKTGETSQGMEKTLDLIMEKFEISPDLSVSQIRSKFKKLMDNTKTL